MYKYLFRFVVTVLTILTANLLTTSISDYMTTYKDHYRPFTFTLIGMSIIIVIFYPLFIKLETWVKAVSVKVIKSGNSVGGKYLGLLFTFLAALSVLVYFYANLWYNINIFRVLWGKLFS